MKYTALDKTGTETRYKTSDTGVVGILVDADTLREADTLGKQAIHYVGKDGQQLVAFVPLIRAKGTRITYKQNTLAIVLPVAHWKKNMDEAEKHAGRCRVPLPVIVTAKPTQAQTELI